MERMGKEKNRTRMEINSDCAEVAVAADRSQKDKLKWHQGINDRMKPTQNSKVHHELLLHRKKKKIISSSRANTAEVRSGTKSHSEPNHRFTIMDESLVLRERENM
jgi:hypothetical protein